MRATCLTTAVLAGLVLVTAVAVAQASAGGSRIPNQYIVVLKGALPASPTKHSETSARNEDEQVAASVKVKPFFLYNAALKGFAAELTETQLRELRDTPQVSYVEPNEQVKADGEQTHAPWDLDRIDQRSLPLDSTYHYRSEGAGVTIYVIDTGVSAVNVDFGGRALFGVNTVDRDNADANGHGTHVAGIAAGTKYGVAKLASIIGVKVLNKGGSGTVAGVIAGVNWVAEHHVPDKSVANMSLGGGKSIAMNDAVHQLVESGVFVSAAAGNNNANACDFSPAGTPSAFTVAASDNTDRKATFSNHGPCVDAYAPGVAVTSDWIGSATATNTISGTSMAAPVVAGIAALYLAEHASTPAETTAWILDHVTDGVISGNPGGTANRLVDKADL